MAINPAFNTPPFAFKFDTAGRLIQNSIGALTIAAGKSDAIGDRQYRKPIPNTKDDGRISWKAAETSDPCACCGKND